jgi:gluconokinase
MKRPLALIFMGVSGAGKTTVAKLFAEKTGAVFYEGDDFHPAANIAKMKRGAPLTDKDRESWLREVREVIVHSLADNEVAAVTCSALKAKYRERLRDGDARVRFIFLTGPKELIEERLKKRHGHFMPATLLDSQLATLEVPTEALTFSIEKSPEQIVAELIQALEAS